MIPTGISVTILNLEKIIKCIIIIIIIIIIIQWLLRV